MSAAVVEVLLGVVAGTVIGSFLNVVIHRVPIGLSIVHPPSHCPSCLVRLRSRHLVPVLSWVVLRGRCAWCRAAIPTRYPLVEVGTGALFGAVVLRFGLTPPLPAFLYLAAVAVVLVMIEVDAHRLPESILLPSYAVALGLLMPAGAATADWQAALRSVLGAAVLAGVALASSAAFGDTLRAGHAELAGLLGLYLGWLSWASLLLGLAVVTLTAGLGARPGRDGGRRGAPRLGPYLVTASVLTVLLAAPVTGWYGALLSV